MRFTRLKKQIENGSFNINTIKTTPSGLNTSDKNRSSKSRKNTKAKTEKEIENDTQTVFKTEPAASAEPEEHNTIRMSMRPRNTTIKLEDPFTDYGLATDIDKYDKYESEGSLYVADDADVDSDDDVPLAKKRKMALASSASKRVRRSSHGSAKQRQTQVCKDRNESLSQEVTAQEKGTGNGSAKAEHVKGDGIDNVPNISMTMSVEMSMGNTPEEHYQRGSSAKGKAKPVENASTRLSPFYPSPVHPTGVVSHGQNSYVADPFWNPLSYSFRSSSGSSNRGFPDTRSISITTDLKRDSLSEFPVQKSSAKPRPPLGVPAADFRREGFMSWRETAARARALQRGAWPISKIKNDTDSDSTVKPEKGTGGQEHNNASQPPLSGEAGSLSPSDSSRRQGTKIVINLDDDPYQ